MIGNLNPWDTDTEASKVKLERFIRSLLVVGGHFTSSFSLAPIENPTRSVSVFFRVWIPEGNEKRFEELSGLKLKKPAKVGVN